MTERKGKYETTKVWALDDEYDTYVSDTEFDSNSRGDIIRRIEALEKALEKLEKRLDAEEKKEPKKSLWMTKSSAR